MSRWRPRLRAMIAPLMLLSISAAIGVLFAELAVRIVRPQTVWRLTPGLYASDGADGYRLAAGYRGRSTNRTEFDHGVTVNAHGLRGPALGAKRPSVPRILVIGDSFPFGVGVEDDETFVARLPQALQPESVEAVNGGIPGIGVPQEVRWLERHGLDLEPDHIVLAVFLGNDLQDATASWGGWSIVDGQLVGKGGPGGLRHWLYFNSHLYALLKNAVPAGLQQRIRGALGLGEPASVRLARSALSIYAHPRSDAARDGANATGAALDRLVGMASARGISIAAVLIPELAQVEPTRWQRVLDQLGVDPAGYDVETPNRIFGELFAQRDIPHLDLTPTLRTAQQNQQEPYFSRDRHWTPAGHALAADALATFLNDLGWFADERDGPISDPVPR